MLGSLISFITPFLAFKEKDYSLNFVWLFLFSVFFDLVSGWRIGLTGIYLTAEMIVVYVYQRNLRLRIRIKFLMGAIFALIYFYVSRRIFF